MTVYAVFKGCYSDRDLMGIFSTEKLAYDFIERGKIFYNHDYLDDSPTEYVLDELKPMESFIVRIEKDNASVLDSWDDYNRKNIGLSGVYVIDDYEEEYDVLVNYNPDVNVMIKAACDKLTAWKASEAGI